MIGSAASAAFAREFDVSRETVDRLQAYHQLLAQWNRAINLVSASSLEDVWTRHFADSAQLLDLAPGAARTWIDLGSGGGFPGIVVAILAADRARSLSVTLVESDQRKAAFLREAVRVVAVDARIEARRVESLPPTPHDVVSARALAPLDSLLSLAIPQLGPGGVCLFPKGARIETELTEARRHWHIQAEEIPSRTDPAARILRITEVHRAG